MRIGEQPAGLADVGGAGRPGGQCRLRQHAVGVAGLATPVRLGGGHGRPGPGVPGWREDTVDAAHHLQQRPPRAAHPLSA
jgi:hypothetical protein